MRIFACLLFATGFVHAAVAQTDTMMRDIEALYARVATPGKILPVADAKQAAETVDNWRVELANISPAARAKILAIKLYAALAQGDAAKAAEALAPLQKEFPERPETLEAAYLVACATADAPLGLETLDKLIKISSGKEKQRLSQRRRWMRGVGEFAPEVSIRVEDVSEIPVAKRGDKVLVIDFWNTLAKPEAGEVEALKNLYEEGQASLHAEFVGVNSDAESRLDDAKKLAEQFSWPQRYELVSAKAPITHEAFSAGRPPWVVVIDTLSYVRAIGSAEEPGLVYAFRAAVAEADGRFSPTKPRSREGRQASAAPEVVTKPDQPAGGGERVSNPEAASKLRQARLYLKTGKKTDAMKLLQEIVRDYPGTVEAEEAQQYLEP